MSNENESGRTFYDLLHTILEQLGYRTIILMVLLTFCVGWAIAHFSAQPGTEVSVWRLFNYTKIQGKINNEDIAEAPELLSPGKIEFKDKSGDIKIGDKVLSTWKHDGCLYPGEIRNKNNGEYLIFFDFSEEVIRKEDEIYNIVSPIYVKMRNGRTKWIPGVIREKRNNMYYIDVYDGYPCTDNIHHLWVTIEKVILR